MSKKKTTRKKEKVGALIKTKHGLKYISARTANLNNTLYYAPTPAYTAQEKNNFSLMNREQRDGFLNRIWLSFIETKQEFLHSDKTLNEIIENSPNKEWVENPHFFDLMQLINRVVMIREKYLPNINYKALKNNEHYQEVFRSVKETSGLAGNDIEVFVMIRNSIAHNNVNLYKRDGTLRMLFAESDKSARGLPYELLKEYVDIISDNIDFDMKKRHNERTLERYRQKIINDKNLTIEEKRIKIDQARINNTTKLVKTREQVHFEVYQMFNKLMQENPDKNSAEIIRILLKKINKKYSDVDYLKERVTLPEKPLAFFFATEPERMLNYDVQQYLRFVFSTSCYGKVFRTGKISQELIDYINKVAPNHEEYMVEKYKDKTDYEAIIESIKSRSADEIFKKFINTINTLSLQEIFLYRKEIWNQLPKGMRKLISKQERNEIEKTNTITRETRVEIYKDLTDGNYDFGILSKKDRKKLLKVKEDAKKKQEREIAECKRKIKENEEVMREKNGYGAWIDEMRNSVFHERVSTEEGGANLSNLTLEGVHKETQRKERLKITDPYAEKYEDAIYYIKRNELLENGKNRIHMGRFTNEELLTIGKLIMKNGEELILAESASKSQAQASTQANGKKHKKHKANPQNTPSAKSTPVKTNKITPNEREEEPLDDEKEAYEIIRKKNKKTDAPDERDPDMTKDDSPEKE